MGHLVGKDVYRRLGDKIDNLTLRAPWNPAFRELLAALYSPEEAELVVNMPFGLSSIQRISGITKIPIEKLRRLLETLCGRGLVIDLWIQEAYCYAPSPLAIGIFEFTMMRTGEGLDHKGWARLFHDYIHQDGGQVYAANFDRAQQLSLMRTLPHETALPNTPHVEILDYEKATEIIAAAEKFSIGICSCRHEKSHVHAKPCDVPMDNCTALGYAADYLIRRNLAREVSRTEMLENLARSRELGLVLNADNVQKNVTYICNCCGCCCNILQGLNTFGYENVIVTSSFIAEIRVDECSGCGKCAKACPVNAVEMRPISHGEKRERKQPVVDAGICLGCGVCVLKCEKKALRLIKRKQRVLHPETTFRRVILQCLERGTLQNQIFDNPQSRSQAFLRGVLGGFLGLPPVKKALMSDTLRSTFLKLMETGVKLQGKGWAVEI
ncbi:MAG: ATP-binding protein [Thermodesulfobacteriota bacterium]